MSIKRHGIISLLMLSMSLPLAAKAASDLTITDNTNQDTTSIIDNGVCSTFFGSIGDTKPHSSSVISGKLVGLACAATPQNCQADVYMTNNCSGPKIATVLIDINSGIKSVTMYSSAYQITGSGFKISADGGYKA